MKKMIIAACAVALAAIAQSGHVNWSAMNIAASSAGAFDASTTYAAYLFIGNDVTVATALLKAKDFAAFEDAADFSRTATYNTTTSKMNFMPTKSGQYTSTDVSAFMIILDAASADKASNYMIATDSTGAQVLSKTFGTTGNQNFAWGDQTAAGTKWTSMSVPEPTSGLLLLLGMAGLALKRKRA